MRITRRSSIQSPTVGDATLPGGPARTGAPSGAHDSVDLSDTARQLQRLRADVGEVDTIATERVRELQQRVDANEYHPAPRAVAERLLSELASDVLS